MHLPALNAFSRMLVADSAWIPEGSENCGSGPLGVGCVSGGKACSISPGKSRLPRPWMKGKASPLWASVFWPDIRTGCPFCSWGGEWSGSASRPLGRN